MNGANVLAKAIYDNVAETADELQFNRGDIVTVLEQNTAGIEGWWLCSLQGRQGIAPGNRLRILPGVYETPTYHGPEDTYDVPPSYPWLTISKATSDGQDEYDIPRRQPTIHSSFNDCSNIDSPTEVYDIPRSSSWQQSQNTNDEDEVYDIPQSAVPLNSTFSQSQEIYNVPSSLLSAPDPRELYDVPPLVSRGPQQASMTEEVYDVPPRRPEQINVTDMITVQDPKELYDVPPILTRINDSGSHSRSLPVRRESAESDVVYDIPQPNKSFNERPVISSGLNSLRRMRREIRESSGASSQIASSLADAASVAYVYDVPPQVTRDHSHTFPQTGSDEVDGLLKRLSITSAPHDTNLHLNRMSISSKDSYSSYIDDNPSQYEELKINLDQALEQLILLKQSLEDAVSNLLTIVKENWRKIENVSGKTHHIQKLFLEVLLAVNKFLVFARGATANACSISEHTKQERAPKQVQTGLRKLLIPLEEDLEMLKRALSDLDNCQWSVSKLAVESNNDDEIHLDEVDSFVMTSRAVCDDAAQMAVCIHTHGQYIFKKNTDNKTPISQSIPTSSENIARHVQEIQALQARPLPELPSGQTVTAQLTSNATAEDHEGWLDDYDYVSLPDKEKPNENSLSSNQSPISGLNKRKTQLLALEREVAQPKSEVFVLSSQEKEALKNLELDVPDLLQSLSQAIDRFINAVDGGKPPHSFVALGKQVILCAHKLVFVGDYVHHHVFLQTAKNAIKDQCSAMCAALKRTVVSTKLAALQWPSVNAVQDMIDKMFEIATCAHRMRLTLTNILSGL